MKETKKKRGKKKDKNFLITKNDNEKYETKIVKK